MESSAAVDSQRERLLDAIVNGYSKDEIKKICFDLDIDDEDLGEATKSSEAIDLIKYVQNRGRLSDLLSQIANTRPDLVKLYPDLFADHVQQLTRDMSSDLRINLIKHAQIGNSVSSWKDSFVGITSPSQRNELKGMRIVDSALKLAPLGVAILDFLEDNPNLFDFI